MGTSPNRVELWFWLVIGIKIRSGLSRW